MIAKILIRYDKLLSNNNEIIPQYIIDYLAIYGGNVRIYGLTGGNNMKKLEANAEVVFPVEDLGDGMYRLSIPKTTIEHITKENGNCIIYIMVADTKGVIQ
jgi:hypothetical protein